MADTLIDHSDVAKTLDYARNKDLADGGLIAESPGTGANRSSSMAALNQDSLKMVGLAQAENEKKQVETVLDRLNSIPLPNITTNQRNVDKDFLEAYEAVTRDAADYTRYDMNAMFSDLVMMARKLRAAYFDQRMDDRNLAIASTALEVKNMQDAALARKKSEEIGGATAIAAGAFQVVCGAVSLGLTFRSMKDLPKFTDKVKDVSQRLDPQVKKVEQLEKVMNDARDKLTSARNSASRSKEEVTSCAKAFNAVDNKFRDAHTVKDQLENELNTATEGLSLARNYQNFASAVTELGNGFSGILQGAGRTAGANWSYLASMEDVKAKQNSIRHDISESDVQLNDELGRQVRDLLITIMTGNKDSMLSQAETGKSIARNMA